MKGFYLVKQHYSEMPLPAKAAVWFTLCNLLLKGISFFTVPLFTRLLSSNEFGVLSVFISYEQIILIFATWEIQLGAYQRGLFKFKEDTELFTTATQCLVNILTLAFFIMIFCFRNFFYEFTGMNFYILTLLFLYLLLQPSYTCWLTRKRTVFDYKPAVAMSLVYSIVNVIFPLCALFFFERTANFKFGATLIGSSFVCLFFYLGHVDYYKLIQHKDIVKKIWSFLLVFEAPVVLHSLSFLILNQADRIMISKLIGNSEAAFYSIAYSLAFVVIIVQTSINQSLLPWHYQMLEANNCAKIKRVTHQLFFTFGLIVVLYILIAPEIVFFLFSKEYHEAIWCIPPITASVFFIFLYSVFVNVESYYEKTKYITYVSVTCGLLNIILNYIFIRIFGYIACSYTTLVSYISFAIGHYYFMKKIMKEKNILDNIIDPKLVILVSFCVVFFSIALSLLYCYPFYRYFLFTVIIVIIVLNRNSIISLFKMLKS